MNYLILSNSADKKEIGTKYPQCMGMPSDLGFTFEWFKQPNSMTKLRNDEFPNFAPDLVFELEKKAKLTDFISPSNISANGFLINQKVKDLLSQFNLMEHRYYPATLIVKGNKLNYYWLHFINCEEKYLGNIDYKNSTFEVTNLIYTKLQDIEIKSRDDFREKQMNLPMKHIRVSKLRLTEELAAENLDLFYIAYIHSYYWCSGKLCKAFQDNGITGIELKNQNIFK